MSRIRDIVGTLYGASMQNMSYPAYFNYLNEGGKITARSLMDTQALILAFLEEQEVKNEQAEENFAEIRGILEKLVDKKVGDKVDDEKKDTIDLTDYEVSSPSSHKISVPSVFGNDAPMQEFDPPQASKPTFSCPECGKETKSEFGLKSHQRSHNKK